jgi:hypothetical protein
MFGYLQRADQRRWARAYLSGLLSVKGKKTLQEMARMVASATNPSYGLQQFINSSPWDWQPARQRLADTAVEYMPVRAWTAGFLNIPKRGEHSVGVHRRFLPDLGRIVNCQVATGLFVSSDTRHVPVDWNIFLDEAWSNDEGRRRRARIPGSVVTAQPLCMTVLGLTDVMLSRWTGTPPPLVVDLRTAYNISRMASELAVRGMDFVIEVPPGQPVLAAARTRPPGAALRLEEAITVAEAGNPDAWQHGVAVSSSPVRLPGPDLAVAPDRTYRLLTQRSSDGRGWHRYWITSILDEPIAAVLALARHTARVETVVKDLEVDFGALDFEGRSFPGWHHHMTMVSAAYLYRTLVTGNTPEQRRSFDNWQQTA